MFVIVLATASELRSRAAPEATVTVPEPKALTTPALSRPPFTAVTPEYVFAALRDSDLFVLLATSVSPPLEMTPAMTCDPLWGNVSCRVEPLRFTLPESVTLPLPIPPRLKSLVTCTLFVTVASTLPAVERPPPLKMSVPLPNTTTAPLPGFTPRIPALTVVLPV